MSSNVADFSKDGEVFVRERFWEKYSLGELNSKEWEALCDGCGQCCLLREVDHQEVVVYGIACELLDIDHSRCSDYKNRLKKVPGCHKLTPKNVPNYTWLPDTCAYRRVYLNQPLPTWHPLLTGCETRMNKKRMSVSSYAVEQQKMSRRQMDNYIIARWPLTQMA